MKRARPDPSGGYREARGRERELGGVRLPGVYYTAREAEAAARAWRDGALPFPAAPMRREMSAFAARPWRELRALVPARGSREAGKRGRFAAFWNGPDYANLGHYAVLSGDRRARAALRGLTELIVERYATWPLFPGLVPGVDYAGRLGQWLDSVLLIRAGRAAWSLRMLGEADGAWMREFAERLARPVLEVNAMPALEYRHDKYHNAMVDAHEAALLAGWLCGRALRVRDLVGGARSWNGEELVERTWEGPKGVRFFVMNAFSPTGGYWESSHTYKLHCLHHLVPMLQLGRLMGRGLGARALGRLAEAIRACLRDMFPNGEMPPLSETHPGRHIGAPVVEAGAWLTGDARLKSALPLLDALRRRHARDPQARFWGRYVHRLFHPAARPAEAPKVAPRWGDDLDPATGQLLARSGDGAFAVHVNWDGYQDYHSDHDALAFCAQHRGQLRAWDPGYHSGAHPYRFWVRKTCSHNAVTVNDEDQRASVRFGAIESFASGEDFTWIQLSAPHLYPGARRYRRSLLAWKRPPFTLVDVFEVEGGWRHRYHLLGLGEAAARRGAGARWRGAEGGWMEAQVACDGARRAALEPVYPGRPRGPRKLVVTREGAAPLRSAFAAAIAFGAGRGRAARAAFAFEGGRVVVKLPFARLEISREAGGTLVAGGRRRRFGPWRGAQAPFSRPILVEVGAVEGPWTVRTDCLACWPLERGMAFSLGRRRYVLSAWQFTGAPLRAAVERSAFEPRGLRLRFEGAAPFRAGDRGAVAELRPPRRGAAPPSHL